MKVYVKPIPSTLSVAMHRVANALARHKPDSVELVDKPELADLQFMHVIGLDSMDGFKAKEYSVIQYCLYSSNGDYSQWQNIWNKAQSIWSYYGLGLDARKFDWLPIGIDQVFIEEPSRDSRQIGVMSSGYVSGPGAEAIEEVAIAASLAGLRTVHLGPEEVVGMKEKPANWSNVHGISDKELAYLYGRTKWVSGLRHIEGFEIPVIEGLSCGARPIVFDRPETRKWFDGHAVFVKECSGRVLIDQLLEVFKREPFPVSNEEIQVVRDKFDWADITTNVWGTALQNKVTV